MSDTIRKITEDIMKDGVSRSTAEIVELVYKDKTYNYTEHTKKTSVNKACTWLRKHELMEVVGVKEVDYGGKMYIWRYIG